MTALDDEEEVEGAYLCGREEEDVKVGEHSTDTNTTKFSFLRDEPTRQVARAYL